MHLDQKVSLKALHTFGMEVQSRYFVEAKTHSEVLTLLNYRHMIHMPILFLGGGSNLLFKGDFAGIVIRINSKGIHVLNDDEREVTVTAEAGENWDDFVRHCVGKGWAGLENLSLIPGTVGAAPIQNIGAYGVEVRDFIESVLVAELDSGKERRYTRDECAFGYRDSLFKRNLKGRVIILSVTFRLRKAVGGLATDTDGNALLNLEYAGIRQELDRMGIEQPGIADVREAVCAIRRRKLPDPAVVGNAGSFFKNPVVSPSSLAAIRAKSPEAPAYPQAGLEGFKVPAAWLIEQCGWKGFRDGDAGVHPDQPLVLVNYGGATGKQVLELAEKIRKTVREKFGVELEPEVNVVG